MKNTFKYLLGGLFIAGMMTACSPEEYEGLNEAGVPQASAFSGNIKASVDQSLNQVTLELTDAKGVFPYWEIELPNGKIERSTQNPYTKIYTNAGDYNVKVRIGNHDGMSDGACETTLHINNTIFDFGKYYSLLSAKKWHIANNEKGHMGCGESGTEGLNWWSASENDKLDWGVYDNELTFTADNKYTFDPGDAGTVYVNNGVSMWADENILVGDDGNKIDFNHKVAEPQTTTYNLEVDGDDLFITFPAETYFPYIPNDDMWKAPRFKVMSMTAKKMVLVSDNGSIAWHYILTTESTLEKPFTGFTYKQADNIWLGADPSFRSLYYAHGDGWEGYPDYTHTEVNDVYTVSLPSASNQKWQAQYQIATSLTNSEVPAGSTYDMSLIISSNNDLPSVTVKLTDDADEAAIVDETFAVTGGEDYVFYVTDKAGIDLSKNPLKLVFDFGGNPDNSEITIKNIVLIDHSKNTELDKLPGNEPEKPEGPKVDWTGENLLANMNVKITQYYAPGWAQIADAEYSEENGVYTIEYPSAAGDQWQAQFTFNNTGIALDPEKSYDFRVKLVSTKDHPGVTVKLTQQDDDNTYLTDARHALVADEETWVEMADLKFIVGAGGKGVITDLKIPFDFGGIADGTVVKISDMYLQEHKGPKVVNWDLTGAKNIWLKANAETREFYYAPGWSAIDAPESEINGNSYTYVLPTATTDRWQAQWKINTSLTTADLDPAKKYDVRYTLVSTTDHPGVTFKISEDAGNGAIFLTDLQTALSADEETVVELTDLEFNGTISDPTYMIVIDAGGNPENCTITVKDIIIQEAE